VTASRLRALVIVLCACGIAGMIVASVRGNNNGWVVTAGFVTLIPALVLLAVNLVLNAERGATVDESLAERVERQVDELRDRGTDEEALRRLVRDAVRLGRRP
jgi:uncharacterized protein YggE